MEAFARCVQPAAARDGAGVERPALPAVAVAKEPEMPKFVTIGYGDQAGYDRTPSEVRDAAHANDEKLRRGGAIMGIAGDPVQVRNADARGVETRQGAFLSSPLPIAGFSLIEADSLAEAIEMVSNSPCAVAHGVIEVWPLKAG
jgi:hypothetical protein